MRWLAGLVLLFSLVTSRAEAQRDPQRVRSERARACALAGDHRCVIHELRGHCATARDFEFLIEALRNVPGTERELENTMRTYLGRFPRHTTYPPRFLY